MPVLRVRIQVIHVPTYCFKCPKCEHEFEGLYPMKDANGHDVDCPKCGVHGVERVYKRGILLINSDGSDPSLSSCPTCSDGVCNL